MKNYIFKVATILSAILLLTFVYEYKFNPSSESFNAPITKSQTKHITPLSYTGSTLLNEFNQTTIDNYPTAAGTYDLATMASQITSQLTQAFSNAAEKPLPLVANWNVGIPEYSNGLDPMYMINRLANGEHIVPTWKLDAYFNDTIGLSYYEASIKKAAELDLPLVFILPSPESALTHDDVYFSMDKTNNPNIITTNGTVLPKLSPFGPNNLWNEVGEQWSTTSLMAQLQEWYPNPPLVLFIDTDSSKKLSWSELSTSSRYTSQYPADATDEFKRTLVNAKWIEKYRQLHQGFKNGFISENWKNNAKFISRNQLALNMGTTSDWQKSATTTNLYANIWPLTADGLTIDFNLDGDRTDITNAPHILLNNLPFMLDQAKVLDSNFTYQLSIDANEKIENPQRYRGFTQFALWFLRPSIIRQTPNKSTKDEINPLFQQVVDSVELVNGSDILADFWKNGKLVKTGDSKYNLNIPAEYQSVPREFLLKTDASSTVWTFALEKGVTPNREWLVYVQSPEGNLSDVTLTVPDVGDLLVDASQSGSFYSFSESSQQTISVFSNKVSQQPDSNTTSLNDYVSPYLEPINLPSCDATNPEVQLIKRMSDWSHINDTDKSIFCVSPGDYSEKTIILTTSGTKDKKRYIVLNNGNNTHPGKLDKTNLAKVSFILQDTNYWIIDRMAYWESPTILNPIRIINSDNNIINRYFMDNVGNGIYLFDGSDANTIQNCHLQKNDINIHFDRAAIGLNSNSNYEKDANITMKNNKIINNETNNFIDGFQAIRSGWYENGKYTATTNVNYEGTIVDGNIFKIDNRIYTDCNGKADINGTCAYAENGIDLKVGSENVNNPMIISNNILSGFKKADTTDSSLNDPGAAMPIHYNVDNIQITNNKILNSTIGIAISDPLPSVEYVENNVLIQNNLFYKIQYYALSMDKVNNAKIIDNTFINFKPRQNDTFNYNYWLICSNSNNMTVSNNIIVNTDNRKARIAYIQNSSFKNNLLYNSLPGEIPDEGYQFYQKDPTQSFSDINLTINKFTNAASNISLAKSYAQ